MRPNVLSGLKLDRASWLRNDPAGLAQAWRGPETLVLPVWRSKHIVLGSAPPEIVYVETDRFDAVDDAILLGQGEGTVYFAVDLSHVDEPLDALGLDEVHRVMGLREIASLVAQREGALLAYANGMMSWHRRHRFCGACGRETRAAQAGRVRECTACGQQHFPRTDPAVIMLVTDGARCLLGRQSSWPAKVQSTLAGFVEPGESLEEAVAREVLEETSVRVGDVRYHSSQPWPFPSSLMLGFTAVAETRQIELRDGELENARWFTRERASRRRPSQTAIRDLDRAAFDRRLARRVVGARRFSPVTLRSRGASGA